MSGCADGPSIQCLILHPTKSLSQDLLIFLDTMSRETLISETLVSHLAVQGFVVKAPKALLKEKVNFELPNDLVVKPVDRVELCIHIKSLNKSVYIHPFVLKSHSEWALIGAVDMVKFGLLGELNSTLTSLYGSSILPTVDHTPPHHIVEPRVLPDAVLQATVMHPGVGEGLKSAGVVKDVVRLQGNEDRLQLESDHSLNRAVVITPGNIVETSLWCSRAQPESRRHLIS
jgi:hypothetical protein